MKRHIQKTGVRKFFGQDLIDLQSEPLKALDSFFAEYGACVVTGCEITAGGDGTFNVTSGLVAIEATDTETGTIAIKVMPFGGAEGVVLPLYLTAQSIVIERVYGDGRVKPIAYDFHAVASGVTPQTPCITLNAAGGNRFVDVLQDEKHSFITAAERTKWNAILQSAKEYADGKDSTLRTDMATADTATLRSAKSYADTIVAALVDNSPEALNTLQELAKAMGNDPNFATTVMQAVGERAKTSDVNAALAAALQSAKEYTDGKDTTLRTDMATADTATLRSAKSYADTIVAALVDNSPEALNTLQELAKAMGNDPNFATTVMQAVGERAKTSDVNAALAAKLGIDNSFAKELIKVGDLASRFGYMRSENATFNTAKLVLGATYGSDVPKDAFSIFNGVTTFFHNPNVNGKGIYHEGNFNPADKAAANHSHTADQVGAMNGYKGGIDDVLAIRGNGFYTYVHNTPNKPSDYGMTFNFDTGEWFFQLAFDTEGSGIHYYKRVNVGAYVFTGTLYHTGNLVNATTAANGLMSADDKTKLESVAANANNYTHPNTASTRHVSDAEKTAWNAKATTAVATTAANGLMSAADKTKLDNLDGKPKCYGYVASNGEYNGTTKGVTRVELQGAGVYKVYHNFNHTNYIVLLTSVNESQPRMNLSFIPRATYFEVRSCNQSGGNSVLSNISFSFVVFEY